MAKDSLPPRRLVQAEVLGILRHSQELPRIARDYCGLLRIIERIGGITTNYRETARERLAVKKEESAQDSTTQTCEEETSPR